MSQDRIDMLVFFNTKYKYNYELIVIIFLRKDTKEVVINVLMINQSIYS